MKDNLLGIESLANITVTVTISKFDPYFTIILE